MRETTHFHPKPNLSIVNRLFGENPEPVTLPFCALTPTVMCSTMAVAYIMRRNPRTSAADVARELSRAWEAYQNPEARGASSVKVCGVDVRLSSFEAAGSVWVNDEPLSLEDFARARTRQTRQAPKRKALCESRGRAGHERGLRPARVEGTREMPEKTTGKQEGRAGRENWPHLRFPNAFVHPYEMTDKNGKTWQKAVCTIPDGVSVNGVDIGGYAIDVFMRSFHMEMKTLGKPVVFRFDPDRALDAFKGTGDARQELKVMPWDLTTAMAKEQREYAESRAREREGNPSLSDQARCAHDAVDEGIGAPAPSHAQEIGE